MSPRIALVALIILLPGLAAASVPQGSIPQTVQPIYSGPELDYQPAIIRVFPGGQLMVVFERIAPASFMGDFYVTFSDDNGESWTTPQPALTSPLNERHPALVQMAPDSFALFYLLADDGDGSNGRIHRATSSDGLGWTDQGAIELGWATPGEVNPCVIREADGSLAMTYHRLGGPSYIARSTDGGVTWDTLRTQVSPGNAQLPRLAKREADGLYLVTYQVGSSDLDIYAKTSKNLYDWSGPQVPFSTQINSHDSQPIVLEDGTFLVAYAMTPVYYFDIFYRTSWDGVNWSDPVQVTDDPSHYDTQPHPLPQGTPNHVLLTWSHQVSAQPYQDHDVYIDTDLVIPADLGTSVKTVVPAVVEPAGLLTYTLLLSNTGPGLTSAQLADPIPPDTAYHGGLWASSGQYDYDPASQTITWTGTISTSCHVTMTFCVSTALSLGDGQVVTNTAYLTDAQGLVYTLVATAPVDSQPPASAIRDPLDGQFISATTYLVNGVATDTVAGVGAVAVSVDGGLWQPALGAAEWTFNWTGFTDGAHNLRSRATDLLGHEELPGPGITVTVDSQPPTSAIRDPLDGQLISATTYLVNGVATDTVAGVGAVAVSVDGGLWQPALGATEWTFNWTGFADGAHNLRSRATDLAGHEELPGPGITVTVDATPPALLASQPAGGATGVPLTATVVLTFSEPIVSDTLTYASSPDPGGWYALWDPQGAVTYLSHSAFAIGQTYSFTVTQARDRAGNLLEPVQWSFATVCPEPQGVQFSYSPALPLVHQTVHLSGSVAFGTPPFTYTWAFGDGEQAEGQYASHAYSQSGTFTVTLTVASACGGAEQRQPVVVVPYRVYIPLIFRR